eukprot:Nk52_evm10s2596 gene=Nk52_evmTU10s2596
MVVDGDTATVNTTSIRTTRTSSPSSSSSPPGMEQSRASDSSGSLPKNSTTGAMVWESFSQTIDLGCLDDIVKTYLVETKVIRSTNLCSSSSTTRKNQMHKGGHRSKKMKIGSPGPSRERCEGERQSQAYEGEEQEVTSFTCSSECTSQDEEEEEDSFGSSSASSSSRHAECSGLLEICCENIRGGQILNAIDNLEALKSILKVDKLIEKHPKLKFQMYKQHFVELLRGAYLNSSRGPDDTASWLHFKEAMSFASSVFEPFALESYAEAYQEYKHALLLLVYPPSDQIESPVKQLWSLQSLEDLAATVYAAFSVEIGIKHHYFLILMAYLISVHNCYYFMNGLSSPIGDIEKILLPDSRTPMPYSLVESMQSEEASNGCQPAISESAIQNLAQAVCIPRHEALSALKYAKGNVNQAIDNELARLKMDTGYVEKLAIDYCDKRGLFLAASSSPMGGQFIALDKKVYASGDRNSEETPDFSDSAIEEAHQRRLRQLRTCSQTGSMCELFALVDEMDESVWIEKPIAFFKLKQLQIIELVLQGRGAECMEIIRVILSPIALDHSELGESLKESVLMVVYPESVKEFCSMNDSFKPFVQNMKTNTLPDIVDGKPLFPHVSQYDPSSLASEVHSALANRLGLAEPTLLKYFKHLLYIHSKWFEMESTDPFADHFMLDQLKGRSPEDTSREPANSASEANANVTSASENTGDQNIECLMDMLNISRAEASARLQRFNGNLSNLLDSLWD